MATVLDRPLSPIPVDIPGKRARDPRKKWLVGGAIVIVIILTSIVVSRLGGRSSSTVSLSLPGTPTRVVSNVPVGYEHNSQGAVAAATNYDVAIGGKGTLDASSRTNIIAAVAARGAEKGLVDLYTQNAKAIVPALGGSTIGIIFNEVPVMWKVDSYSDAHAVVEVWQVSVVAAPTMPVARELWGMDRMDVVWEGGDWKLANAVSLANPPTMAGDTTAFPTPPGQLIAALTGFQPYYEIAGR